MKQSWNGVAPPLHLHAVAIEKEAFGSPSTKVADFTFLLNEINTTDGKLNGVVDLRSYEYFLVMWQGEPGNPPLSQTGLWVEQTYGSLLRSDHMEPSSF